jgi:nucleoside-diphosphate-sugar epimerase
MHILITGAVGLIGRKLTERLVTERALGRLDSPTM